MPGQDKSTKYREHAEKYNIDFLTLEDEKGNPFRVNIKLLKKYGYQFLDRKSVKNGSKTYFITLIGMTISKMPNTNESSYAVCYLIDGEKNFTIQACTFLNDFKVKFLIDSEISNADISNDNSCLDVVFNKAYQEEVDRRMNFWEIPFINFFPHKLSANLEKDYLKLKNDAKALEQSLIVVQEKNPTEFDAYRLHCAHYCYLLSVTELLPESYHNSRYKFLIYSKKIDFLTLAKLIFNDLQTSENILIKNFAKLKLLEIKKAEIIDGLPSFNDPSADYLDKEISEKIKKILLNLLETHKDIFECIQILREILTKFNKDKDFIAQVLKTARANLHLNKYFPISYQEMATGILQVIEKSNEEQNFQELRGLSLMRIVDVYRSDEDKKAELRDYVVSNYKQALGANDNIDLLKRWINKGCHIFSDPLYIHGTIDSQMEKIADGSYAMSNREFFELCMQLEQSVYSKGTILQLDSIIWKNVLKALKQAADVNLISKLLGQVLKEVGYSVNMHNNCLVEVFQAITGNKSIKPLLPWSYQEIINALLNTIEEAIEKKFDVDLMNLYQIIINYRNTENIGIEAREAKLTESAKKVIFKNDILNKLKQFKSACCDKLIEFIEQNTEGYYPWEGQEYFTELFYQLERQVSIRFTSYQRAYKKIPLQFSIWQLPPSPLPFLAVIEDEKLLDSISNRHTFEL